MASKPSTSGAGGGTKGKKDAGPGGSDIGHTADGGETKTFDDPASSSSSSSLSEKKRKTKSKNKAVDGTADGSDKLLSTCHTDGRLYQALGHQHPLREVPLARQNYHCDMCWGDDTYVMYSCMEVDCNWDVCSRCIERILTRPPYLPGALSVSMPSGVGLSAPVLTSSSISSTFALNTSPSKADDDLQATLALMQQQLKLLTSASVVVPSVPSVSSLPEEKKKKLGQQLLDALGGSKVHSSKNVPIAPRKSTRTSKPSKKASELKAAAILVDSDDDTVEADDNLILGVNNVADNGDSVEDPDDLLSCGEDDDDGADERDRLAAAVHAIVVVRHVTWTKMYEKYKWVEKRNKVEAFEMCAIIDLLIDDENVDILTSDVLELCVRRVLAIQALDQKRPLSYVDNIRKLWVPSSDNLMPASLEAKVRRETILEHKLATQVKNLPGSRSGDNDSNWFGGLKKKNRGKGKKGKVSGGVKKDDSKRAGGGGGSNTKSSGAPAK